MLPWEEVPHAAEILHRDTVDTLRAGPNWHWAYQAVFAHDLPGALAKTTCPVFFVCGAKDLTYEVHCAAVAAYPQYPSHVHEEAGVFYVETHPKVLAPHLVEFVDTVNARNMANLEG